MLSPCKYDGFQTETSDRKLMYADSDGARDWEDSVKHTPRIGNGLNGKLNGKLCPGAFPYKGVGKTCSATTQNIPFFYICFVFHAP